MVRIKIVTYRIADENISFVEKYINDRKFTEEALADYQKRLSGLEGTKEINESVEKEQQKRDNRGRETLSYAGEIIILFFILSIFFIALSFYQFEINYIIIILFILFIIILSFTDFSIKFVKIISKVVHAIKK